MPDMEQDGINVEQRSTISCLNCRGRKVKCSRELPSCKVCEASSQECEFPEKPLRPGPKIGSSQVSRKRNFDAMKERSTTNSTKQPSQSAGENAHQSTDKQPPVSRSPQTVSGSPTQRDVETLSFFIHPLHEPLPLEERSDGPPTGETISQSETSLKMSSQALGISLETLDTLLDQYFATYMSFQLFREPNFRSKIQYAGTVSQVTALLAAMFSFAIKGHDPHDPNSLNNLSFETLSSNSFGMLAADYVDLAIKECGDEPIPFLLLQALVLLSHWLLIRGVRGRAWRYLGICVRAAYDLDLHRIDANREPDEYKTRDPELWCEEEEKRRTWWAIWEMDVFVSVVRRCPSAIDWAENEAFLPVEDDKWLSCEPQPSCILQPDLVRRWKSLQATGNQSPKAWFIVVNSLVKDAQRISSPVGVGTGAGPRIKAHLASGTDSRNEHDSRSSAESEQTKNALHRLSLLQNSLQCTLMALPTALKYRGQFLSFGMKDADREGALSRRILHSSVYAVHMLAQLAKLMVYQYYIFRTGITTSPTNGGASSVMKARQGGSQLLKRRVKDHSPAMGYAQELEQYFEAAGEVMTVVSRSSESHYRFVNPFLSNTMCLAAAVLMVQQKLALVDSDKEMLLSNFEYLSLKYRQFTSHWNTSIKLQNRLELLVNELESLPRGSLDAQCESAKTIASSDSQDDELTGNNAIVSRTTDAILAQPNLLAVGGPRRLCKSPDQRPPVGRATSQSWLPPQPRKVPGTLPMESTTIPHSGNMPRNYRQRFSLEQDLLDYSHQVPAQHKVPSQRHHMHGNIDGDANLVELDYPTGLPTTAVSQAMTGGPQAMQHSNTFSFSPSAGQGYGAHSPETMDYFLFPHDLTALEHADSSEYLESMLSRAYAE